MDELLRLLGIDISEMTADELADHRQALAAAAADAAAEDRSDETLEALEQAATQVAAIDQRTAAIAADEAERESRAAAALLAITGQDGNDGEDDDEDDDDDDDESDEDDDEGADEGAGADANDATPVVEAGDQGAEQPQAIAAAGTPAPVVSRVAPRRPATPRRQAAPAAGLEGMAFTASANVSGVTAGQRLRSLDQVADAFVRAIKTGSGFQGPATRVSVITASSDIAPEYTVGGDTEHNSAVFDRVQRGVRQHGTLALAASAGACAPYTVWYDQPVVGTDARPVRDQVCARVMADRGGVTYLPTIGLSDVLSAVSLWDDDNGHVLGDGGTTTKPRLEVACQQPQDANTYDVVTRLLFSNYSARYFRERVEAILTTVLVAAARKSEQQLLTAMADASVEVTSGQLLGATRDILTTVDRAVAAFRYRYRLAPTTRLRFALPSFARDMMRADLTREMPGSSAERLATADAQIEQFFAVRNVTVVWLLDGESGQRFGTQYDGVLLSWPSSVVGYLGAEGEDFFLDGGSLDLGIVRDSTLNGTNKFEMFAETAEGYLHHGPTTPLRISMDVCPDGATSEAVSIDPCTTGS